MRLFIAEKPSLARAIADVLPGPQTRRRTYIECGGGDVVAWCAGHILELAEPEQYSPTFKAWAIDTLPIAPERWKLAVTAPELLDTIRTLLPRSDRVVHAGDPDREGQLLVDEVLEFLEHRGPVDRLLISDLNPPAVRKALTEMRPNSQYRSLYEAALARQRADWLLGINLTRLYTVLGRRGGYDGVLSVGRVQTPLLGLVVRRDVEIGAFLPRPYYVVRANVQAAGGTFTALWVPSEEPSTSLDEAGRIVDRELADAVHRRTAAQKGVVTRCARERKSEPAPLPYALPDLQVDAGKRLAMSPKETLDACQSLYETHHLLTYPRSDCAYLPTGHFEQAMAVLSAIAVTEPALMPAVNGADGTRRSRAWNDEKVTAHHAIVPTAVARPGAHLSRAERAIYDLVARRYLAQFYPAFEFNETKLELEVAGELFRVSGRQPLAEGWRRLLAPARATDDADEPGTDGSEEKGAPLPLLREGEPVTVTEVSVDEKQTAAPKRFTDATLIQAMTGIARYVTDPNIKQLLRETDGIGTPATQAQVIQTLFDRKFIEKKGRQIHATAIGRALIQALPSVATQPDLTALWETAIRRIAERQMALPSFLTAVLRQLRELIASGQALGALKVPGARPCSAQGCSGSLRARTGRHGAFWSCSRYPECKVTIQTDPAGASSPPGRGARRARGARSQQRSRP